MPKLPASASWVIAGTLTLNALAIFPPSPVQAQRDRLNPTEILAAHNAYRRELNLPPLIWSEDLAQSAQEWADHLAEKNIFEHSKSNYGENLWKGTANLSSQTNMVDGWGSEKKNFQPGIFPDVSTTGKWSDVGHYTQIVWKNTTTVGCGLATGGRNDFFVCHYDPPGNYEEERVY